MLIAEDLLMLAIDDATGKSTVSSTQLEPALAGAVLMELVVAGRVGLEGEERKALVIITDATPLGDPVLDAAMQTLLDKSPLKPGDAIHRLAKGLREQLFGQLAERGLLRREAGKILGVFPTTRWPAPDSAYENEVRGRLAGVLLRGRTPGPR
jgi:hypothetical protein